jgi:hypothetical protein
MHPPPPPPPSEHTYFGTLPASSCQRMQGPLAIAEQRKTGNTSIDTICKIPNLRLRTQASNGMPTPLQYTSHQTCSSTGLEPHRRWGVPEAGLCGQSSCSPGKRAGAGMAANISDAAAARQHVAAHRVQPLPVHTFAKDPAQTAHNMACWDGFSNSFWRSWCTTGGQHPTSASSSASAPIRPSATQMCRMAGTLPCRNSQTSS